jgi:hypothetical protein
MRLPMADSIDIGGRHFLDSGVRERDSRQTPGFDAVHPQVIGHPPRQTDLTGGAVRAFEPVTVTISTLVGTDTLQTVVKTLIENDSGVIGL